MEHILENISLKLTTIPNTELQNLSFKISPSVIRAALGSSVAEKRDTASFTVRRLWQEDQCFRGSLLEWHTPWNSGRGHISKWHGRTCLFCLATLDWF